MFLRAGQMAELDAQRTEVLGRSASIIQRKVRAYLARRRFISVQKSAIFIQALCRGDKLSQIHYLHVVVFLLFLCNAGQLVVSININPLGYCRRTCSSVL